MAASTLEKILAFILSYLCFEHPIEKSDILLLGFCVPKKVEVVCSGGLDSRGAHQGNSAESTYSHNIKAWLQVVTPDDVGRERVVSLGRNFFEGLERGLD